MEKVFKKLTVFLSGLLIVTTVFLIFVIPTYIRSERKIDFFSSNQIVDETETKRMIERYTGSELAQSRGWTDDYLAEHLLAVRAKYYVEYDHTKTFLDDGNIDQFFYLIEDTESGVWTIIDNSTNGEPTAATVP